MDARDPVGGVLRREARGAELRRQIVRDEVVEQREQQLVQHLDEHRVVIALLVELLRGEVQQTVDDLRDERARLVEHEVDVGDGVPAQRQRRQRRALDAQQHLLLNRGQVAAAEHGHEDACHRQVRAHRRRDALRALVHVHLSTGGDLGLLECKRDVHGQRRRRFDDSHNVVERREVRRSGLKVDDHARVGHGRAALSGSKADRSSDGSCKPEELGHVA
ncbi:hypothetical protein ON010_g18919 [Phytophthora cinnamomi]|nr:hypothetical protein ON010_g18919 [Phytophthora cinnamomi]